MDIMQVKTQRKSLKHIKPTICLFNNGELSLYVKGYTANVKNTLQGEQKTMSPDTTLC